MSYSAKLRQLDTQRATVPKGCLTLGVIGGIGPESTIEYYRAILASYRDAHGAADSPPAIIINSIDVNRLLGLGEAEDFTGLAAYLAAAGANLGILAANTPHVVFDDVSRASPTRRASSSQRRATQKPLHEIANRATLRRYCALWAFDASADHPPQPGLS